MANITELLQKTNSHIGIKEGSKEHKKIIDTYNKQEKLPRGYKVKYTDSWCATFVSYIFMILKVLKFPFECSCYMMIEEAKKRGLWIEDDEYIPSPGDCVLYDWQDNGKGDNKGTPDHIGIVENCTKSGNLTIVEGNYSDSVKRRSIKVNGKYIRGFIKSSSLLSKTVKRTASKPITDKLIKDVIAGKYGNGIKRIEILEDHGYNSKKVQEAVNKALKK